MGIAYGEFRKLWNMNTTAEIKCRNIFNEISGISLRVRGIKGGKGYDANRRQWYRVFIDIDTIRSENIPDVFILDLADNQIQHVNIFHPQRCRQLNRELPKVCWGDYRSEWNRIKRHNRTLVSLVKRLEMLLSEQNFNSPAR